MPQLTVELRANSDRVQLPIVWRVGKLFNVVTSIRKARVTANTGVVILQMEGSREELDEAADYLKALGVLGDRGDTPSTRETGPESKVPQPNTINVRLETVTRDQAAAPILYRVGRDFTVVSQIERAAFDSDESGFVDIALSGPLLEVQRAIAYLHTTGIHVNPKQRSVTDFGNL